MNALKKWRYLCLCAALVLLPVVALHRELSGRFQPSLGLGIQLPLRARRESLHLRGGNGGEAKPRRRKTTKAEQATIIPDSEFVQTADTATHQVCARHVHADVDGDAVVADEAKTHDERLENAPDYMDSACQLHITAASRSRVLSGGGQSVGRHQIDKYVPKFLLVMYAVVVAGGAYMCARFMATGSVLFPSLFRAEATSSSSARLTAADVSSASIASAPTSPVPHSTFLPLLWENVSSGLHYIYMTYH